MNGSMLEAALGCARQGYRVLPLHNPVRGLDRKLWCSCGKAECSKSSNAAKHPRTEHGVKDAKTDEAQIRNWWRQWPEANIGIALSDRDMVLDVDPRASGHETLLALCEQHGQLPKTSMVQTGSGGFHYYFRLPDGLKVNNSTRLLGSGLNIKTGGGYVVAPPSLHISDSRYAWELSAGINDVAVADAPQWLLDLISQESSHNGQGFRATDHPINEGEGRNNYLYRLGRSEKARGHPEAVIRAAMEAANKAVCKPPLDSDEFERIFNNVMEQADRPEFDQQASRSPGCRPLRNS